MRTYRLRVPASRVVYVPEAQGGLPQGPTHCMYWVRVPASGVYGTHPSCGRPARVFTPQVACPICGAVNKITKSAY